MLRDQAIELASVIDITGIDITAIDTTAIGITVIDITTAATAAISTTTITTTTIAVGRTGGPASSGTGWVIYTATITAGIITHPTTTVPPSIQSPIPHTASPSKTASPPRFRLWSRKKRWPAETIANDFC